MYEYIDNNIEDLKKYTKRIFNNSRLRLLRFDEVNVLSASDEVTNLYMKLRRKSDEFYKGLILFLSQNLGFDADKYNLAELLSMYESTLLYSFTTEYERKKARYFESIMAIGDVRLPEMMNQQKKNIRFWNTQVEEFAVGIERKIFIDELKSKGIKKVMWVTASDEKVCSDCADLNGKIFDIDNVPARPHLGCRCILVPVKSE